MTSKIILDNITTSCTPARFTDGIVFDVTFTLVEPLSFPLGWKIIYVGSAYNEDHDQILEEFEVDLNESCGTLKFDIECNAPDASKIPRS